MWATCMDLKVQQSSATNSQVLFVINKKVQLKLGSSGVPEVTLQQSTCLSLTLSFSCFPQSFCPRRQRCPSLFWCDLGVDELCSKRFLLMVQLLSKLLSPSLYLG